MPTTDYFGIDTTDLDSATRLVDQLSDAIRLAGKVRAQAVVELRDEHDLSLAQLGARLGLSKAQAADIVRDATRTRAEQPLY